VQTKNNSSAENIQRLDSLLFLSFGRLRHERNLMVNLKYEEERLSKEIEQEENDMRQLVDVMAIIEK
jgi:hypothetical protein